MYAQNQFQHDKSIIQENTTAFLKDSSNIKLNERFFSSASVLKKRCETTIPCSYEQQNCSNQSLLQGWVQIYFSTTITKAVEF